MTATTAPLNELLACGAGSKSLILLHPPTFSSSPPAMAATAAAAHCCCSLRISPEKTSWRKTSSLPRQTSTRSDNCTVRSTGSSVSVSWSVLSSLSHGRSEESSVVDVVGGTGGAGGGDNVVKGRGDGQVVQSRRAAVVCLLASVAGCDAASAAAGDFSPGFPGLRDWLRGQKQKTAGFLLAPINASRDRLSSALLLVSSDDVSSNSYEEAENLVKVAARDCMPLDAGSILDFQSRSGVEVCTFKLVLKNAASLLANTDPTKLKAEESLRDLIRSFVTLDEMLASGATGGAPDRKNLEGALAQTSVALDQFEGGVRACLGIA